MGAFTFTRMYPEAVPPMRADKAALGYMPTSAFQYCEAMRAASRHGWYLFPPADIKLRWNGADVLHLSDSGWEPLSFAYLPGFAEYWDDYCPPEYQGMSPPFLRALPANGAVQVWSGWLISSVAGWSTLVRPLVNIPRSHFFYCYEGVIETDEFAPCPLFINLQLTATDVVLSLPRTDPLFQVQPIHRSCHGETALDHEMREGFRPAEAGVPFMDDDEWKRFRGTIRTNRDDETHRLGDYAVAVRKRRKGRGENAVSSAAERAPGESQDIQVTPAGTVGSSGCPVLRTRPQPPTE